MKCMFLILLSVMSGCQTISTLPGGAASDLPKDLPAQAEIHYNSQGGMVPTSYRIDIVGAKMTVTSRQPTPGENQSVEESTITEAERQELYRSFVENHFESLKPNENLMVADGRSRSIELKFGDKRFFVINGDGYSPPDGHLARFLNIEAAFKKLTAAHPSAKTPGGTNK